MTLLIAEIGIINTEIIIIRVIVIAINVETIAVIIVEIIKIKKIITLKNKKIRINIRIKDLK